jgi:hypothetical protein
MKSKLMSVMLSLVFGITITFCATSYYYKRQISKQEFNLNQAQSVIKEFCGGHDLGAARITNVVCNEKQELCICGSPEMLQSGRVF